MALLVFFLGRGRGQWRSDDLAGARQSVSSNPCSRSEAACFTTSRGPRVAANPLIVLRVDFCLAMG